MEDELESLRAALAARQEDCWDRFEDAVTELLELYLVPLEEIIVHARELEALASAEQEAPARHTTEIRTPQTKP